MSGSHFFYEISESLVPHTLERCQQAFRLQLRYFVEDLCQKTVPGRGCIERAYEARFFSFMLVCSVKRGQDKQFIHVSKAY